MTVIRFMEVLWPVWLGLAALFGWGYRESQKMLTRSMAMTDELLDREAERAT